MTSKSHNIDPDPSDSAAQRDIEIKMLERLVEQHPDWQRVNWKTLSAELGLAPVWQKAEPDAVWETGSEIIIAECYSRIGALSAGHYRKLAMDALKLIAIRDAIRHVPHVRCLLVVPRELADRLKGDGWFPSALRLASDVIPVDLLESEKTVIENACARQAQGQARTKRVGKECLE